MNKDITEVREARKCVKDAMEDVDVSDVVMWTAHDVRWVLEEIWDRFVTYRERVLDLEAKYKDSILKSRSTLPRYGRGLSRTL